MGKKTYIANFKKEHGDESGSVVLELKPKGPNNSEESLASEITSGCWKVIKGIGAGTWGVVKTVAPPLGKAVKATLIYSGKGIWWTTSHIWQGTKWVGKTTWSGVEWTAPRIWQGTKWVGKTTWSGVEWTSPRIWQGTKWVGKTTWSGVEWTAPRIWQGTIQVTKWGGKTTWKGVKWIGRTTSDTLKERCHPIGNTCWRWLTLSPCRGTAPLYEEVYEAPSNQQIQITAANHRRQNAIAIKAAANLRATVATTLPLYENVNVVEPLYETVAELQADRTPALKVQATAESKIITDLKDKLPASAEPKSSADPHQEKLVAAFASYIHAHLAHALAAMRAANQHSVDNQTSLTDNSNCRSAALLSTGNVITHRLVC